MLRNVYRKRNGYLRSRGITYQEYLKSDHWKNIRRRYFRSKLYKGCYICGSRTNIQIHHKTYKRFGREWLNDLLALCTDCHKEVHEYHQKNPQRVLYAVAKKVKKVRNMARLTSEQIEKIREDFISGKFSRGQLATKYGIGRYNVNQIVRIIRKSRNGQ